MESDYYGISGEDDSFTNLFSGILMANTCDA